MFNVIPIFDTMKQGQLSKKDIKVINGMQNGTKKKFNNLMDTIKRGVSVHELKGSFDVSEMWIPGYEGKNIYRVKFDFRFRAFVQEMNGKVNFVKVVPREGAY